MNDAAKSKLLVQVISYLQAQPTRKMRLEFPVKIPAKVVELINTLNTDPLYAQYKDRLEAAVKPYA